MSLCMCIVLSFFLMNKKVGAPQLLGKNVGFHIHKILIEKESNQRIIRALSPLDQSHPNFFSQRAASLGLQV